MENRKRISIEAEEAERAERARRNKPPVRNWTSMYFKGNQYTPPEKLPTDPEEIEKAKQCRSRLIELCCGAKDDKLVFIKCNDFDKYGRLLVKIYETKEGDCSINEILVKEGLAKCYDGGKKN